MYKEQRNSTQTEIHYTVRHLLHTTEYKQGIWVTHFHRVSLDEKDTLILWK